MKLQINKVILFVRVDEAKEYMDKLYSEIKQTGKYLKTSHAAINALIRAKMIEAEEKGDGPIYWNLKI